MSWFQKGLYILIFGIFSFLLSVGIMIQTGNESLFFYPLASLIIIAAGIVTSIKNKPDREKKETKSEIKKGSSGTIIAIRILSTILTALSLLGLSSLSLKSEVMGFFILYFVFSFTISLLSFLFKSNEPT